MYMYHCWKLGLLSTFYAFWSLPWLLLRPLHSFFVEKLLSGLPAGKGQAQSRDRKMHLGE